MYNAVINNLSPLPFYLELDPNSVRWDSRQWFAFGQVHPLLCDSGISPFFIKFIGETDTISEIKIYKMCKSGGIDVSPSDFTEIHPSSLDWFSVLTTNGLSEEGGYITYTPSGEPMIDSPGIYYMDIDISVRGGVEYHLVSEIFRVVDVDERYIKVEWSNDKAIGSGVDIVPERFANSLLLESTIARPEYSYEEEGEERLGFFYPTKQISYKKYRFGFVAPEYLCDVVRMIPMCDHLTLKQGSEVYNPTKIDFDIDWTEVDTLASVECEFTTNTIVKRVASGYIRENLTGFNENFSKL